MPKISWQQGKLQLFSTLSHPDVYRESGILIYASAYAVGNTAKPYVNLGIRYAFSE
jgi:hypothetical protein